MKTISLVIPVYNEEESLDQTLFKLYEFLKTKIKKWEIIFVNDGSTDSTLDILKSFEPRFFRILSYNNNQGKGYAIKNGMLAAKGDSVGFTDGDLAYSFDNIELAFNTLKDAEVVIGSRRLAPDNFKRITLVRKILGRGFSKISNKILGYNIRDSQCGLKVFRAEAANQIFQKQTLDGFSFDTEVLYIAKKYNLTILEVPAKLSNEHAQKNSKIRLIRDSIKMFKDILEIKRNNATGKYEK